MGPIMITIVMMILSAEALMISQRYDAWSRARSIAFCCCVFFFSLCSSLLFFLHLIISCSLEWGILRKSEQPGLHLLPCPIAPRLNGLLEIRRTLQPLFSCSSTSPLFHFIVLIKSTPGLREGEEGASWIAARSDPRDRLSKGITPLSSSFHFRPSSLFSLCSLCSLSLPRFGHGFILAAICSVSLCHHHHHPSDAGISFTCLRSGIKRTLKQFLLPSQLHCLWRKTVTAHSARLMWGICDHQWVWCYSKLGIWAHWKDLDSLVNNFM